MVAPTVRGAMGSWLPVWLASRSLGRIPTGASQRWTPEFMAGGRLDSGRCGRHDSSRMARLALAGAASLVGILVLAHEARSQTASTQATLPAAAAASVGKDQGTSMDTKPLGPITLVLPALTLTAPSLLPGQRYVPDCDADAQTRGNSEALGTGLPLMGSFVFQLAPRLSVLGFSRLGCPITSGMGAVVAYEMPVTRSLSFSLSGGVYGMPQALDKGVATRGLLRADLVKKDPGRGLTQTWGVQALGAHGTSSTRTVNATYGLHW